MKTLLDFYADWCGPCIAMKPTLTLIETELKEKIIIKRINVDENSEEASKYGIVSIPTFIILDENGLEVAKRMGAVPKDQFMDWVKTYI